MTQRFEGEKEEWEQRHSKGNPRCVFMKWGGGALPP